MNVKTLIKSYLEEGLLLQVATSTRDTPWICTVCFAQDAAFNLYWFSRHNTRHSQEIVLNPQVAGAIALPYSRGEKTRGLQLSGVVTELIRETDLTVGLIAMQKRYGTKNERIKQLRQEILTGAADYGLYRLHPEKVILYDTLNFPDSPRREYQVPKITTAKRRV